MSFSDLCGRALLAIASFILVAPAARADFVLGVNLNGPAATIDGNLWQSESAALTNGYSFTTPGTFSPFTYSTTPIPAVDAATAAMIQNVKYLPFGTPSVTIHQAVPSGSAYRVELWTYEGFSAFGRSATISGDIASTSFNYLNLGQWEARSHTTAIIGDGSIDFTITSDNNQPVLSGYAVFTAVPEPHTAVLMSLGVLAALGQRRRKIVSHIT